MFLTFYLNTGSVSLTSDRPNVRSVRFVGLNPNSG
jgi:hypothetical protein